MENTQANSVGIVTTQKMRIVEAESPLRLRCGKSLGPIDVAYETYGQLADSKDNVVLICHALSGNAHAAGYNSDQDRKPGWWDIAIGPGKAIDTNKYFVICPNNLGSCSGTTGPSEINPAIGKPYGLEFPIITIEDIVRVQKLLLDKLGIERLLAVVGGSMGGMAVLQWAIDYPSKVDGAICIASTARLNAQSIAFDAVGRNAILADPAFQNGQYHEQGQPARGLGIARMIGHITYLSEQSMREKFGRNLRAGQDYKYDFNSEFSVETYLDYQGQSFVERFDANSYLYISKAMDYFDLNREYGSLREAFAQTQSRFLIISFTSDWLFTPRQSEEIVHALAANGKDVSYCNIDSPYGHDAFLLDCPSQEQLIAGFLDSTLHRVRTGNRCIATAWAGGSKPKLSAAGQRIRVDYELIESLIEPGSRILDLGCEHGELMSRLIADKGVLAEGVEINENLVVHCVRQGLSVIHRDIGRGLEHYPDGAFDYVIVSKTVQTLLHPEKVIDESLRIGKRVIVSFPNFAHWACRLGLLFNGRAPVTKELQYQWYDSPNIHFLSIKDFDVFCAGRNIRVEKKIPLGEYKTRAIALWPNLLASQVVYVASKHPG